MGSDIGIQFSLRLQSRVLVAQPGGRSGASRWLTGTNSLREDNEIRILQYDPDQERLISVGTFNHAPEVWSIAPSAKQEDRFITVWAKGDGWIMRASMMRPGVVNHHGGVHGPWPWSTSSHMH